MGDYLLLSRRLEVMALKELIKQRDTVLKLRL